MVFNLWTPHRGFGLALHCKSSYSIIRTKFQIRQIRIKVDNSNCALGAQALWSIKLAPLSDHDIR